MTGTALFNVYSASLVSLLTPPGLITRVDPYTGRGATLDLCFGSGHLSTPSSVNTLEHIGSDHLPVKVIYEGFSLSLLTKRPKWNFKMTDANERWQSYQQSLESEPLDSENEIHVLERVSKVTECIVNVGKNYFKLAPGRFGYKPSKPWWNEECDAAVRERKKARREWVKRPERYYMLIYRRLEAKSR